MKYKNSKWLKQVISSSVFSKFYFPQLTIIIIAIILLIILALSKWLQLPVTFKPYNYIVVDIKVYDQYNKSLKTEFFDELRYMIDKSNASSQIQIDSTATSVVIYQRDRSYADFTDLCIHLNDQTLNKMRTTKSGSRNISSSLYVYQFANYY